MKTAILIIAAGASRRLGQPKQLVPYRDTFLLNYIINQCLNSNIGDVFVVLGANRSQIEPKISSQQVTLIYNEHWSEGMSTSIGCGSSFIQNLDYEAVIVMLGDQPFFQSKLLKQIIEKQIATKARIVISNYDRGMGPPSFFNATLFDELAQLRGDVGAKPIIRKYFNEIERIAFPKGYIDIDNPSDLKYLL